MSALSVITLLRDNMGAPVRLNVGPRGEPTGQPGVTAVVELRQGLGWCVLADHPVNPGVSVTHGAQMYAEAVCRLLEVDVSDLAWIELDSDGHFDEIRLLADCAAFAPLLVDGQPSRSVEALLARLTDMGRSPSQDGRSKLLALAENFGPKK